MSKVKRLYRSEKERMVAGVAGGLAEYFQVDPTFVRIGFVVSGFLWGTGLVAYAAMWLLVPSESNLNHGSQEALNKNVEEIRDSAKKAGDFVKGKVEDIQKDEE